jgi:hypothetical protein
VRMAPSINHPRHKQIWQRSGRLPIQVLRPSIPILALQPV